MKLDLTALVNAIARLEEGVAVYARDEAQTLIRDAVIQRFEFTDEISHKMLKRYLEEAPPTSELYDTMSFQDLIRSGNEQGLLLGDWPTWKTYREIRARTSHTDDERVALEVIAGIPSFLEEARYLRNQIEQRQT
ncbi:MAG: nucleotidyltransferase [Chloroflexota bacterium]|nr:MAG: nucleotidyltransferase [Chloroflexota bacterium]